MLLQGRRRRGKSLRWVVQPTTRAANRLGLRCGCGCGYGCGCGCGYGCGYGYGCGWCSATAARRPAAARGGGSTHPGNHEPQNARCVPRCTSSQPRTGLEVHRGTRASQPTTGLGALQAVRCKRRVRVLCTTRGRAVASVHWPLRCSTQRPPGQGDPNGYKEAAGTKGLLEQQASARTHTMRG